MEDKSNEEDMWVFEEIADMNAQSAAEDGERLMPAKGGMVDPNHWSHWTEDNSGGCIMPRISGRMQAWIIKNSPEITWDTSAITSESLPEDLGEAIRAALRANRDRRL